MNFSITKLDASFSPFFLRKQVEIKRKSFLLQFHQWQKVTRAFFVIHPTQHVRKFVVESLMRKSYVGSRIFMEAA